MEMKKKIFTYKKILFLQAINNIEGTNDTF